jgi:hypothetical protein
MLNLKFLFLTIFIYFNVSSQTLEKIKPRDTIYIIYDENEKMDDVFLKFTKNKTNESYQYFFPSVKHLDFKNYLDRWGWGHPGNFDRLLTFSVSPKLSVSGEKWDEAIKPEVVADYGMVGYVYLKFVVASQEDADEAEKAVEAYREAGFRGPVYLMPVGGVESVYHMNNRAVAELAMKKGYRYSDRLQVPLFKNEWGT